MDILICVLLFLVGICSAFIQRVSGFGQGIFAMLFLPHFLPTHTASAAICSLFSCATTTYNAWKYKKHIAFRVVWPLMAAALITIPIAVRYATKISGQTFQMILGVVLVVLSVYFLVFSKKIRIRPTLWSGLLTGSVSGVLSGLFSTGGPPIVLYLTNAIAGKDIYFATIQFFFCTTSWYSAVVRIMNGILTVDLLGYAAVGLVGCMIGDSLGRRVFDRIDSELLKKIIYIGMIISGILMIL